MADQKDIDPVSSTTDDADEVGATDGVDEADEADRRAARELEERLEAEHEAELEAKRKFVLPKPIPHFSLGAFFMPPIWGAAHGQWVTILFYPLWVFADSTFRTAYHNPQAATITFAVIMFIMMTALTVFYAATAQRPAYWRVKDRCSPEKYAKQEIAWAIGMGAIGIAFIAIATWYNLCVYVPAA